MRSYVGITDKDWFTFLASQAGVDEVNFWKPGGAQRFAALSPGELFLFKLHSPDNFVVGGGFFAHFSSLPVSLAWDVFSVKNGARSLSEMRARIEKCRGIEPGTNDYTIGCVLLESPFFLTPDNWIPVPRDWSPAIQQGKTYDLTVDEGRRLYDALQLHLPRQTVTALSVTPRERYGEPTVIRPRLGQGSFRVIVTDAYNRCCSVTSERTLPVLDAAHIHPYKDGGAHDPTNGLLLRTDLHRLFDKGYLTVTPDLYLEVSRRIKEEFDNGRDYYALQGHALRPPHLPSLRPAPVALRYHNENVFLG